MRYGMTAFARAVQQTEHERIQIEIRSLNHRYLELFAHLPEELRALEASLRERLRSRVRRGKIDLWLSISPLARVAPADIDPENLTLWRERLAAVDADLKPSWGELLSLPGVLQNSGARAPLEEAQIFALFDEAMDALMAARQAEGEAMTEVITARLADIRAEVEAVRQHYPIVRSRLECNLRDRIEALQLEVDGARFEQELVYLLGKMDIAEELDRLSFHVEEAQKFLSHEAAVGRRLDFLTQELNREANTLAAKSADSLLSRAAVNLKVFIEQIREQVQNLE